MHPTALLLITLLAPPSLATASQDTASPAEDARAAERLRLEEELQRLVDKGAWRGVERVYDKLSRVGGLTVRDHLLAAQAALSLGHTLQAQIRLQRALAVDPGAPLAGDLLEVKRTLDAIHSGYGRVRITVEPGRKPKLVADRMPFEANPRHSIEYAAAVLASERHFVGWIPVGHYRIDGTPFEVEAGAWWKEIHVVPVESPSEDPGL